MEHISTSLNFPNYVWESDKGPRIIRELLTIGTDSNNGTTFLSVGIVSKK